MLSELPNKEGVLGYVNSRYFAISKDSPIHVPLSFKIGTVLNSLLVISDIFENFIGIRFKPSYKPLWFKDINMRHE
jgi:hypothetical protein